MRRRRLRSLLPWRIRHVRLLPWVLIAVLAGLTGTTVHGLADRAETERSRWGEVVSVAVARHPLEAGRTLTTADVDRRDVPRHLAPPGALAGAVDGRATISALETGEILLRSRVAPDGVRGVAALLPPGRRAMAVTTGATGRPPLLVGDRVDVLASGGPPAPADVVARAAPVLHVDADGDLVTVAVTPAEAPVLAAALASAAVTLALTSPA